MMSERRGLAARLITATGVSRTEARERCLILVMFRHGLRV